MNKRIRELAEQAEDYATEEYDKWIPTFADDFSGIPNIRKIFNEKFAELIVRECAAQVDWILAEGGKTQGDLIREHFCGEEL